MVLDEHGDAGGGPELRAWEVEALPGMQHLGREPEYPVKDPFLVGHSDASDGRVGSSGQVR